MKSDKLVIIGGDERRVYMEEFLNNAGYNTILFEKDRILALNELRKENVTAILPLPFSLDGININIKLSHVEMSIDYFISFLKPGDRVFGGMISADVIEKLLDKGIEVYDFYDEDLIVKNALLTAIGLKTVFKENLLDVTKTKSAITGFGRTAKAVAEMINANSGELTIFARSDEAVELAKSLNYNAVNLKYLKEDCAEYGIIINTVPAVIIEEPILKNMNPDTVIIDIASHPFGVDINTANKHSIKVIRAVSLPGKYTPDLAGTLIGEKIQRLL